MKTQGTVVLYPILAQVSSLTNNRIETRRTPLTSPLFHVLIILFVFFSKGSATLQMSAVSHFLSDWLRSSHMVWVVVNRS